MGAARDAGAGGKTEGKSTGGIHAHRPSRVGLGVAVPPSEDKRHAVLQEKVAGEHRKAGEVGASKEDEHQWGRTANSQ